MKYKMIVLDLDGTLTNNKKLIIPHTKQALMLAQAAGVHVVLASGRPTYGIVPLAEELKLKENNGYILAFNGGKIIDCTNNKVLFEQKLDEQLVPLLYQEAKKANMEILTYQGEGIAATKKTTNTYNTRLSSIRCPSCNTMISFISWSILSTNVSLLATLPHSMS